MPGTLEHHFPALTSLPRAPLATPHIPIRHLSIKRDDLTSPTYGGNKVRKLEFLLGQAQAERRKAVITFGAYGSNHALATAVHARALGIEPHAILSPQVPTAYARATVLAHAGLGTVLHPIEGFDGARAREQLTEHLSKRDGCEPLVIPMGGSSALGVATRVVAVRVTPATVANETVIARLASETIELLRKHEPAFPALAPSDLALTLREGFYEPGYAEVTSAATGAVAVARELGVKLETTYTGRAFAALLADAAEGMLADADVVFWDTYNSAPMPAPAREDALPPVLREFVAECR